MEEEQRRDGGRDEGRDGGRDGGGAEGARGRKATVSLNVRPSVSTILINKCFVSREDAERMNRSGIEFIGELIALFTPK